VNAAHELAISAGIVDPPSPSLRGKEILAAEFRTFEWFGYRHRCPASAKASESSAAAMPAAAVRSFGISESREKEFGRILGTFCEDRADTPKNSDEKGQNSEPGDSFHIRIPTSFYV
jgi:hypothetical protein